MNVKLGDNFTFYCNTFTPATGAAVDADAVPGYRVYSAEATDPILTGSMALLDDGNTVGMYSETIACTTGNGFAAGGCYVVRITGVVATVTGVALVPFQVTAVDVDDLVRSTTPANTLDVSATGEAGLDFANVKAASAPTTLTNITVPTVTAVTGLTAANLDAAISTRAVAGDAMALTSGERTTLATAVWASATRTLTSFGTLVAGVWAYATRTLTQSAASVAAAVAGSDLVIHRGDSWSESLTGLGDISTRTKLWFTVKGTYDDADSAAIIQIEETAGLVYLNGAAGTAAQGDITVDDAVAGDITITLGATSTAALAAQSGLAYDVQVLTASAVTTPTSGVFEVTEDVTRATS